MTAIAQGPIAAETAYTLQPADYGCRLGWHYRGLFAHRFAKHPQAVVQS